MVLVDDRERRLHVPSRAFLLISGGRYITDLNGHRQLQLAPLATLEFISVLRTEPFGDHRVNQLFALLIGHAGRQAQPVRIVVDDLPEDVLRIEQHEPLVEDLDAVSHPLVVELKLLLDSIDLLRFKLDKEGLWSRGVEGGHVQPILLLVLRDLDHVEASLSRGSLLDEPLRALELDLSLWVQIGCLPRKLPRAAAPAPAELAWRLRLGDLAPVGAPGRLLVRQAYRAR